MSLKRRIQNFFLPLGTVQKIRSGYLRGYRIRLTENSLWAPILGKWEPAMQKIMANVIEPGQVVYDLGANNGLHGLLMARLVGEKGVVYNFEPLQENIEEINDNFSMNGISNFKNVQAAVSDNDGIAHFTSTVHPKQGSISQTNADGKTTVEVTTITLDRFIKEGNPGPSFMKVDIEGAEGPALHGFSLAIRQSWPLMIIELHNPEQDREVGKFLKDNHYTAYRFDPFAKLAFQEVEDFTGSYPDPKGVWGTLFCLPPEKKLSNYHFDK